MLHVISHLPNRHIRQENPFTCARAPIGATPADLGRVMNNACDKFASHACKRVSVIPLAVPFYRPIPRIQLSNSFHAAKYYSVIPYDHPCAATSQRVWDMVCTWSRYFSRVINVARHVNQFINVYVEFLRQSFGSLWLINEIVK